MSDDDNEPFVSTANCAAATGVSTSSFTDQRAVIEGAGGGGGAGNMVCENGTINVDGGSGTGAAENMTTIDQGDVGLAIASSLTRVFEMFLCWPLVAEEPHRSATLNLEHCPIKANVSCLVFPLHQGKTSSAQPLSGLDSPSQGSRGQLTSTPPCHSPPFLFPFATGKATRTHPALALLSPCLP
jgi:hypothetical protein